MNQVGSVGTTTGAASWSAAISDSSLLGATAGVAASFGEMAVGAARIGSNMIMQVGDILTGGYNHDHPVMQQVWSEQRALGAGIVNALTSPVLTTTNLIEGTVNRYDNAMGQSSNFDRSYELGKLFNDVGQGAIGAGSALRGAARLGVSGLEFIGDTAFTGPSSQTAIRANVEANIAATRLGSASSNINIFFAKSDQIASGYQADVWTGTVLKQDSVVYALRPGASAYFTDFDTVQGARLDSYSLSQALQVKPHEIYGYRPDVTGFRVTQDVFVPGGRAIANSAFGAGGGTQFFIENSGKYLEPITTINLKKPL